jgi:hypothetical protein
MLRRILGWFVATASLGFAVPASSTPGAWAVADSAAPTSPEFFKKYLDCDGIAIRSSSAVADEALRQGCNKITLMLQHIPEVRHALVRRGAELHIIGRDEQTSDLPEFRRRRGKLYVDNRGRVTTIDARTRGMGGLLSSCGEENLLHLPGDRYNGSETCIHEFAHAIMDYGLDVTQRRQINDQYERSITAGLWHNAYAATDAKEYWAELSVWYFGSHGARRRGSETPSGDGPEALKSYDPLGFALIQRIYSGIHD